MVIEVPDDVERVLTARANLLGVSPVAYSQEVLRRGLTVEEGVRPGVLTPLKTGRGMLAKYGPAPSAEEVDANRAEMFRNFGEGL